jgi:hypothetical protein
VVAGIGAANMKHFVLFLLYTWISSILALVESVYLEYFVGLLFAIFGLTFVTYILSHTLTSIRTGLGTIDRLQMAQPGKLHHRTITTSRGLLWSEIFGANLLWWWFPVDPRFRDPEKVFGYTTIAGTTVSSPTTTTHNDVERLLLSSLSPRSNTTGRSRFPSHGLVGERGVYQTHRYWDSVAEAVEI